MSNVHSRSDPPGVKDRRQHRRVEMWVEVEVHGEDEVFSAQTRNISEGGVFLAIAPGERPLTLGATAMLYCHLGTDARGEPLSFSCAAVVVRTQTGMQSSPAGIGLQWKPEDAATTEAIARVVEHLKRSDEAARDQTEP